MAELNEKLPAVLLDEKHAKLVAEKKKTGFIKSENYRRFVGKEIYVVANGKVWAKIKFIVPRKISLKKFKALEAEHKVSTKERKSRWPDAKEFFFYKFDILQVYSPPLIAKGVNGARVFANQIEVVQDIEDIVDSPKPKPKRKPKPRPSPEPDEPMPEPIKNVPIEVEQIEMREHITRQIPEHELPPTRGRRLGDYLDDISIDEVNAVILEGVGDEDAIVSPPPPARERHITTRTSKSSKVNNLRERMRGSREIVQEPAIVKQIRKENKEADILSIFKRKLKEGK